MLAVTRRCKLPKPVLSLFLKLAGSVGSMVTFVRSVRASVDGGALPVMRWGTFVVSALTGCRRGPASAKTLGLSSQFQRCGEGAQRMGGHTQAAHAPTPPVHPEPVQIRVEVESCLDEIIELVMKRFYAKQVTNARRRKRRKEEKEQMKFWKK